MLEYTKAAINTTISDLKTFFHYFSVASQSIYVIYLIYAIFASAGNLLINIILLTVAVAYFIFYIATHGIDTKHMKRIQGITKHSFTWFKLMLKALTLGITIYSIYATATHVTAVSVILAALTAVSWLLQVIFELTVYFLESRARLLLAGIEADWENLTKPVEAVGNIFKRLTGNEVTEEKPEPTKARKRLDLKVSEAREERARKKQEKKLLRAEKKRKAKE